MMRLVATTILLAALSGPAAAGPAPAEATQIAQQCAASLSPYQAVARLGVPSDARPAGPDHQAMTLTPGQVRSLQIGEGAD